MGPQKKEELPKAVVASAWKDDDAWGHSKDNLSCAGDRKLWTSIRSSLEKKNAINFTVHVTLEELKAHYGSSIILIMEHKNVHPSLISAWHLLRNTHRIASEVFSRCFLQSNNNCFLSMSLWLRLEDKRPVAKKYDNEKWILFQLKSRVLPFWRNKRKSRSILSSEMNAIYKGDKDHQCFVFPDDVWAVVLLIE